MIEGLRYRYSFRGVSMTNEASFISTDSLDHDPYTRSQTRERTLNAAIIRANISDSFEEYLEIFDEFYADEIEVSSEPGEEPIRGKVRVRSFRSSSVTPGRSPQCCRPPRG